ncbi:MAG: Hsp20/alpha crystallin family protein [Lachnospiraceae bacterium]|nr:Hsp20/alpha crystallin family protein [Lachnospiraceae bacterium]
MLRPSIFGENLFDDWFSFPELRTLDQAERKLYGQHASQIMKTDVHEQENQYDVDIDLPGFDKNDISLELDNGYLVVSASKNIDNSKDDKKGRLIMQERYSGSMQRSFFVGDTLTEEDIKASFKDGVLSLMIPKKTEKPIPEKKQIFIEG